MAMRRRILIVEDADELRRVFRDALALEGFDVQEARSGYEALRYLDSVRPDLIILDLRLPGLDGIAVRDELAAGAHTREIPVIVVTGSTENLEPLDLDRVLRKPVAPDELIRAVRECLASHA
jgi:CheY-like chemotaxis protein